MFMGIVWFAAFAVFLVLEGVTYQIVSIWFAIGALGGLAAELLGAGEYMQIAVFLLISVALICLLRPISLKLMKNKPIKTNAESLIGKDVLITEDVDNLHQTGKGKVNGMEWTVRGENDIKLENGSTGEIVRIEGVKLIVKRRVQEAQERI